ncbi:SDR family oxidoreductase [Labrys wisconsinensis]|uniref:NAD(P)-dependent dehydrogenase (Short-subunit alcohol dehydrogenase family) n=1 Tax=Labrys wisconsinensis TaxID=425677 RepID=A0ABU0JIQ3_9HYPH|nr:SDR family oxidoreductase [Labrys wisconsinensis]MDQ0474147.1 NAD(P)-dependent dehydrogenase (short-subunit alcohol dehydrogenase family) [Labrys wisconsinensis]
MDRLKGKRALITGGTSGIGLATARRFVAEGARVAVTGTDSTRLEAARSALGPDAVAIPVDSGDAAAQKGVAEAVACAFGQLDAVFVNAGIGDFRPLEQWDEAGFDRSLAVNFKGPFFLVQALLPVLANPASIVLNTSINAHIGMPNSSVYAASKAALLSLARTLSGELLPRGIRVNAVSPGPVATPLHGKIGMDEAAIRSLAGQIPLGRRGDPDEIAQAVVFLASDEGGFTVGSEFIIDGGMSTL